MNQSDLPARWQIAGEAASEFRIPVPSCPLDMPPGTTCKWFEVHFTPRQPGERRATLEISTAASRLSSDLVGIGVAP